MIILRIHIPWRIQAESARGARPVNLIIYNYYDFFFYYVFVNLVLTAREIVLNEL